MDRQGTSEDVKKLAALAPKVGELVPWAALEEILGISRQERRFRTIYRAWIRYLRKWHNRKMIVVPGQGLRLLPENERATDVCNTLGRTWNIFDRAKQDVDDIQIVDLTTPEVEEAHFVRHLTHTLHRTMSDGRTKLATRPGIPEPTPAPPQRLHAVIGGNT